MLLRKLTLVAAAPSLLVLFSHRRAQEPHSKFKYAPVPLSRKTLTPQPDLRFSRPFFSCQVLIGAGGEACLPSLVNEVRCSLSQSFISFFAFTLELDPALASRLVWSRLQGSLHSCSVK